MMDLIIHLIFMEFYNCIEIKRYFCIDIVKNGIDTSTRLYTIHLENLLCNYGTIEIFILSHIYKFNLITFQINSQFIKLNI
jgi:hypothetical protein